MWRQHGPGWLRIYTNRVFHTTAQLQLPHYTVNTNQCLLNVTSQIVLLLKWAIPITYEIKMKQARKRLNWQKSFTYRLWMWKQWQKEKVWVLKHTCKTVKAIIDQLVVAWNLVLSINLLLNGFILYDIGWMGHVINENRNCWTQRSWITWE